MERNPSPQPSTPAKQSPALPSVSLVERLRECVIIASRKLCSTLPVMRAGRVVGVLTLENVRAMILINAALGRPEKAVR